MNRLEYEYKVGDKVVLNQSAHNINIPYHVIGKVLTLCYVDKINLHSIDGWWFEPQHCKPYIPVGQQLLLWDDV